MNLDLLKDLQLDHLVSGEPRYEKAYLVSRALARHLVQLDNLLHYSDVERMDVVHKLLGLMHFTLLHPDENVPLPLEY